MRPGRNKKRTRILALLVPGLMAGAYCLSAAMAGEPPRGFNEADVMFLQMAVRHEAQGVTIVRLAAGRPVAPALRTLAEAIETTQLAEVGTMAARLRSWRRPPVAPPGSHAAHGGQPETAKEAIDAAAAAPDTEFGTRFVNLLIAHQDDAVQIARRELAQGSDPAARALATSISRSRSAQIEQLLGLLPP
ncbi:DUF305 domain-containing protein [Actinocorallia longicatena]|uniref:DUF305 domain-containing protein n=1 Tax=Actinocorallia longicatena TaxID=111803 RepID=A0ABP6Q7B1_9ACTN